MDEFHVHLPALLVRGVQLIVRINNWHAPAVVRAGTDHVIQQARRRHGRLVDGHVWGINFPEDSFGLFIHKLPLRRESSISAHERLRLEGKMRTA